MVWNLTMALDLCEGARVKNVKIKPLQKVSSFTVVDEQHGSHADFTQICVVPLSTGCRKCAVFT